MNPYGLQDVAGNVSEWTCSLNAGDRVPLSLPCAQKDDARRRIIRGGSWKSAPWALATWARMSAKPDTISPEIGFRLVEELPVEDQNAASTR